MGNTPSTPLTEANVPSQEGKVFIVTGSSGGIGKLLANILYGANGTVYIAARNASKANAVIQELKTSNPNSKGHLHFLMLQLDDLTTIKKSAEEFLSKEKRLDVLWNNAGVMVPPQGSVTAQKYELQLGTNCIAPFLFTQILTPLLVETAKSSPKDSVRIVWTSSSASWRMAPEGGIELDNLDYKEERTAWNKYGASKAGNILHSAVCARRLASEGIISVSLDPGNLKTDLWQEVSFLKKQALNLVLKDPIFGAYTELFAGLSPDVTMKDTGCWIESGGHVKEYRRKDITNSCKTSDQGGTGVADEFWKWTEDQVKPYM